MHSADEKQQQNLSMTTQLSANRFPIYISNIRPFVFVLLEDGNNELTTPSHTWPIFVLFLLLFLIPSRCEQT